ncbi:MAG: Ig-like domain-containing protein [Bacteroidales bacterium]|nr:Ig-like domain-containing protein [Bacteroidales bacterium]
MKTLRNILHIVLAALLLASCVREELVPRVVESEPGDQVTIDGSIDVPIALDHPWTKSMQEIPGIKRLFVAVFDESDMMTEIKEAFPGTKDNPSDHFEPAGSGSNYLTTFHVTLTRLEAGTRYVEFIAVSDASKNDLLRANRRSEAGMALSEAMKISDNEEAFFGRKTFLFLTEQTDMKGIKLIRNYAKVTLNVSGATAPTGKSINITGYKVFNVPKTGTIAPFNSNSPELATIIKDNVPIEISNPDCFAHYDLLGGNNPYSDITNGFTATVGNTTIDIPPYTGFMNGAVEFEDYSSLYNSGGTTDAAFPFLAPSGEDFLYECPFREADENPFMIIKAEWTEGNNEPEVCYYKADFVYKKDGVNTYYNILRNFQFTLSIGSVAEKGASTIYEAVNSIAMNNFESSTMAMALTNISNGNERLYISATDRLLTTGRIDTVYLRNSVFANGEWNWDTDGSDNYGISHTYKKTNLVGRDGDLITGVNFDGVVTSSDPDKDWVGWTRVIVNFADPYDLNLRKGMVWKQSIVFYNTAEPALSRTCVFTRRRPFDLFLDVQDYVAAVEGQSCRVDIKIPAGLTEARFPLEFYIEQEKNTLYPDATSGILLPVNTGKTQIPGRSGNNYYFTRIITWQEYSSTLASVDGYRTFPSYFKTLVAQSATTLWVMPASADGHFSIQDDVLDVFTNKDSFLNEKVAGSVSFQYSSLVVKAGDDEDESVESRTNEATAISGAAVTYTSSDPSVATVSSKGVVTGHAVGTATITASCDAYGAYNAASASYTVTVAASNAKLPGLVADWARSPITIYKTGASPTQVAIYAVSENNSPGAITITYTSSNTSVASISESGGVYYVNPGSAGTATITATASIAPSDDYVADSRVLTYQVTVTAGYAESGSVFHNETFLGRNPEQPAVLMTDYESKWQSVSPADATFHSQSDVWHNHPRNNYGAYAIGWHDQSENDVWADTDSWLVSPEIDLAASRSAKLTFSHAASYHLYPAQMKESGFAKVMLILASDYDGSAGTPGNKWVDISPEATQYPFPDYKYVPAAIDLTPYAGKKIRIAFKYSSSSDASHAMTSNNPNCSWEVKNVVIREN